MSSLTSLNRNMTRIAGLSSGMDTEKLISEMMKVEQQRIDRQYRAQAKMEWKVSAYQDVNNELRKLKDEFSTVLKQEQNMLSAFNYKKFSMNYQNASDTAYVTMKAQTYAQVGSVSIQIEQIAKAASVSSTKRVTGDDGEGLKLSMTMKEVNNAMKATMTGNGYAFNVSEDGMMSFTLNGREYTFSENATLESVINTVNATDTEVKFSYSQLGDKFTLTSRKMGTEANVSSYPSVFFGDDAVVEKGQKAIFSINGVRETRDSNEFEIDGIIYTLKQPTVVRYGEGEIVNNNKIVNVSIERDIDSTVELVKKYAEAYNTLVEKLRGLLSEKVDRDYYPLTESEKGGLSEKEGEKWELEAKKGLLRNDSQLNNLLMRMRESFYMKIPGSDLMMSDIGIGVAAWTASNPERSKMGLIDVDEAKLRKALTENPDLIVQMFTFDDSGSATPDVNKMGLASRLNKLMDNYIKHNERETQYYANMDIARAKERYVDMVEAMYKKEEQIWARFTAMETAMSNLNAQNAWLQQQLGLSSAGS